MSFSLAVFLLFSTLLDQNSILDEAAKKGFFYRFADIAAVEKCPEKEFCIDHLDKKYLIKRKDSFSVTETVSKNSIEIEITPENRYISYFLYIQHKAGIHKIQMNKKKIVIDQGVPNILKLQIVGTAPEGPKVIWQKPMKETSVFKFSNNFDESLKKLRSAYFVKPLSVSDDLEPAAIKALERLQSEGLIHYSAKTGGVRHTGIDKKVLGENLFVAENIEKAWEMLTKSPSHLYNMINPQFKSYFVTFTKTDDSLIGVIIFSD